MVPINSTLLISVHKKRHRDKRQDNSGSFSEDLYPDCFELFRDKFLPRILVLLSMRGIEAVDHCMRPRPALGHQMRKSVLMSYSQETDVELAASVLSLISANGQDHCP